MSRRKPKPTTTRTSSARARRAPARPRHWLAGVGAALRPPPRLSLSEWADRHFYLSPESAAEPGRWKTLPYQKGILDAFTDPAVWRISVMKSARVGYTKCLNAAIAYFLHQDPCPIMVVQPTVEDAEGYSKEEIAPMLRDVSVLADLVQEPKAKTTAQTILDKRFRNGSSVSMVGATSGRGFRRTSRRFIALDEIDGYPASAGAEGDPVKLAIRRSEYYWNRLIAAGSTPLLAGHSQIEALFEEGDGRRYHVPCPHCGHRDFLVFSENSHGDRGHFMRWPDSCPDEAFFVCRNNGCVIEESSKRAMLDAGGWVAERPFNGHASFHIWAAYSLSPNATWAQIAFEFLDAKGKGPEKLKTFVNTVLGETWREKGDAPDWERLYLRREPYELRTVPDAAIVVLTAGADVQKDRIVFEVVGWAPTKESWSLDAGEIPCDTSNADDLREKLDELQARTYHAADGRLWPIALLAVDSGFNTQQIYNWARRHPMSRVIAVKGVSTERSLVGAASPVDVTISGKKLRRGYKVFPVGVDIAKSELYGWLKLPLPDEGAASPPGWCHFPEHPQEFFKQLTAETLVTITNRRGYTTLEWRVQPGRQNHALDCRVYARVAAAVLGIDRMRPAPPPRAPKPRPTPEPPPAAPPPPRARRGDGWFSKGASRERGRPGGWFGRRRR